MARRIAEQLCKPRYWGTDDEGNAIDIDKRLAQDGIDLNMDPLSANDVVEFDQAALDGGSEFQLKIVGECLRLVVDRSKLPAPINPTKTS